MTAIQTATGLQAIYGEGQPGEYTGENQLMGVMTEAGSPVVGSFWFKEGKTLFQPANSTKVFELPAEDIKSLVN